MIYLELFFSFFQIGLFSIGGGYAAMPLIQKQVVDLNHWLSMGEFVDIITISQMTPGLLPSIPLPLSVSGLAASAGHWRRLLAVCFRPV